MAELSLIDSKNIVISAGDTTKVVRELMKIIKETGVIPEVFYDNISDYTRLVFEGYHNNVTLYLKAR